MAMATAQRHSSQLPNGRASALSRCAALKSQPAERGRHERGGETEGRIAIIGMAGRFPGAQDIATFWRNLCNGVESVTFFTDDQLEDGAEPSTRASASYIKARPVLPDVDQFDADFSTCAIAKRR